MKKPKLIIIMGVSGSGKSTIASELSKQLGWRFIEADDFHSHEAKTMMSQGIPLTDEIRLPWLRRIASNIQSQPNNNAILAYSGLKAAQRQIFGSLGFDSYFFYLTGSKEEILERLTSRKGHFMSPALLDDQIASMEPAAENEKLTEIKLQQDVRSIISSILVHL